MPIRQWPVRETKLTNAWIFYLILIYLGALLDIYWLYAVALSLGLWYYFVRFMNWWTAKYTTKENNTSEFWEQHKENKYFDPKKDYASRITQQEDRKKDVFDRIGVITEVYQDHSGIIVTGTFSEEYLRTRGKEYYA